MFGWLKDIVDWVDDAIDEIFGNSKNKSNSSNKSSAAKKTEPKKTTVENAITNPYGQAAAKTQQQQKQQEQNRNDAAYNNKSVTQNFSNAAKNTTTSSPAYTPSTSKTTSTASTSAPKSTASKTSTATSSGPDYKQLYEEQKAINESNTKRIEELENPKILSAQEVAKLLGIDYNEANILKDYNKATNEYYDAAIDELQGIRTDYDKNNTQYLDQIMDSYLESYKHTAPTAAGKGTLAANALSTLIGAAQSNAVNDYSVIQDINLQNEARKKDLANNPNLARQQYNDLGLALSGLSTQFDKASTLSKVKQLDAYGKYYAADQSLRSQLANANAAKYSGLANAAGTAAANAANNYSNQYQKIMDVYFGATNNKNWSRNAISNLITDTQGK